jgi:hypothetical protein
MPLGMSEIDEFRQRGETLIVGPSRPLAIGLHQYSHLEVSLLERDCSNASTPRSAQLRGV